jgi:hypothetical protein
MDLKDIVPIIVLLLGLPVGLISAFLVGRLSRGDFLGRQELEFRERQLSEFYGPVYGYLKSQRDIFSMWRQDRMLDGINLEVKKLFAEQNAIVRRLIVSKAHLIDSPAMPESFVIFCTSTLIFDIMAARSEESSVPPQVAGDPRAKYPDEFLQHISETTEALKARVDGLHKKYAISLSSPTSGRAYLNLWVQRWS